MEPIRRPLNTIQITDTELASTALSYLKAFYKYRTRIGETQTQMGVESEKGIVVDGYLSFQESKEKNFIATVETTDYWHREELRYKHTLDLLMVDGLTIAFLIAVIFLGYFYFTGQISLFHLGVGSSILGLFLSILLAAAFSILILWPRRRYRYIYAIEQFKKYYADDQWIAFTFDVFPDYEDKHYNELRLQCIRYGFGLIELDAKKNIKVHATPARVDAVKNNREIVEFNRISSITKSVTQTVGGLANPISKTVGGLSSIRMSLPDLNVFQRGKAYLNWQRSLLRFRRSYYNQMSIIATCFLLICGLIFEEWQKRPIVYVDEETYPAEQIGLVPTLRENHRNSINFFKIDSGVFIGPQLEYVGPVVYINNSIEDQEEDVEEAPYAFVYEAGIFKNVDCSEFKRLIRGEYVIFFTSYYELEEAKRNAIELRNADINANVIWADCLFYDRPFYLLIFDTFFMDEERANRGVRNLSGAIKEKGLNFEVNFSRISR